MSRSSLSLFLVLLTSLGGVVSVVAQDAAYQRAEAAFEAGDYEKSRNLFRTIVKEGEVSEEVFHGLGSAHFRLGDFGEAALAYRRAQYLSPRLTEAAQNLGVIEKRVGFLKFQREGIEGFLSKFREGELVWAISLGGWIAVLAFTVALFAKRMMEWRPLLFVTAFFGLALALASVWGLSIYQSRLSFENRAIVVGTDIEAHVAPTPDAEIVIALPPGSEVLRLVRRGPWDYVEIPGKLRGWIRSEVATQIWPIEEVTESD